jgi:hypothetical protein
LSQTSRLCTNVLFLDLVRRYKVKLFAKFRQNRRSRRFRSKWV